MLPEANILSSELGDAFCKIDLSRLTPEEMLALADISEECFAGLCHSLHFTGKAIASLADNNELEFSAESLYQLGHGLKATAALLPGLMALSQQTERAILSYKPVN